MESIYGDYSISFCTVDEVHDLKKFIDVHWKKNHPLSVSDALLDWQHYDKKNQIYNFVIGRNRITGEIDGILGFIPTYQFDDDLRDNKDIWLAIWKKRVDVHAEGLGIALFFYLQNHLTPRSIVSCGLSTMVVPLYKAMRFTIGKLNHHYIINNNIQDFYLIENFDGIYSSMDKIEGVDEQLLDCNEDNFFRIANRMVSFQQQFPTKSLKYLYNRYIKHPIYQYKVYALEKYDEILGFLVVRVATFKDNNALRMVEFYGDSSHLAGMYILLEQLLIKHNAEYLDYYNLGISDENLKLAGFLNRKESNVIVPNYFEPFERKNVDLDYAYKADVTVTIQKGDSDQDRPTII
jgi:hypothetical protein